MKISLSNIDTLLGLWSKIEKCKAFQIWRTTSSPLSPFVFSWRSYDSRSLNSIATKFHILNQQHSSTKRVKYHYATRRPSWVLKFETYFKESATLLILQLTDFKGMYFPFFCGCKFGKGFSQDVELSESHYSVIAEGFCELYNVFCLILIFSDQLFLNTTSLFITVFKSVSIHLLHVF